MASTALNVTCGKERQQSYTGSVLLSEIGLSWATLVLCRGVCSNWSNGTATVGCLAVVTDVGIS